MVYEYVKKGKIVDFTKMEAGANYWSDTSREYGKARVGILMSHLSALVLLCGRTISFRVLIAVVVLVVGGCCSLVMLLMLTQLM